MITIAKTGKCNSNYNSMVEEACEEGGLRLTNSESDRRLLRLQYHSLKTLIGGTLIFSISIFIFMHFWLFSNWGFIISFYLYFFLKKVWIFMFFFFWFLMFV
jgi:hypothetical protein